MISNCALLVILLPLIHPISSQNNNEIWPESTKLTCQCDPEVSSYCREDNTCDSHEVATQLMELAGKMNEHDIFGKRRRRKRSDPVNRPGTGSGSGPNSGSNSNSGPGQPPPFPLPTRDGAPADAAEFSLPTSGSAPNNNGTFKLPNLSLGNPECERFRNGVHKDVVLNKFVLDPDYEPTCVYYPEISKSACSMAPSNTTTLSYKQLQSKRVESMLLWACNLHTDISKLGSRAEYCQDRDFCNKKLVPIITASDTELSTELNETLTTDKDKAGVVAVKQSCYLVTFCLLMGVLRQF